MIISHVREVHLAKVQGAFSDRRPWLPSISHILYPLGNSTWPLRVGD